MNRRSITALLMICILAGVFMNGCAHEEKAKSEAVNPIAPLTEQQRAVNEYLKQKPLPKSMDLVKIKYGKPTHETSEEIPNRHGKYQVDILKTLTYPGFKAQYYLGKSAPCYPCLISVVITKNYGEFTKVIAIGDPESKVREKFGPPDMKNEDHRGEPTYCYAIHQADVVETTQNCVVFEYSNGHVSKITWLDPLD